MAKVALNPALQEIHGRLAGFVYRIRYGKQTISKTPDMSNVKWSAAQIEHRRRFKLAVAYARLAMDNEKIRLQYMAEAEEKGKRPFDLAVSDYFKGRNLLMESKKG